VKKNQVIAYLFAMSVMVSVSALADEKYPASNFQPEVVYQDKDYIEKNSSSSVEVDSKYPAANFEPKIIYSDSSYKQFESPSTSAAKTPASQAIASGGETPELEANAAESQEKEETDSTYVMVIVGLLALVVGFVLFRGKFSSYMGKFSSYKSVIKTESNPDVGVASQKLTGVARYLKKMSGTGVSRYIEKQAKSTTAVTGVARYVARQKTTLKELSVKSAVTGVEKYMRNRG